MADAQTVLPTDGGTLPTNGSNGSSALPSQAVTAPVPGTPEYDAAMIAKAEANGISMKVEGNTLADEPKQQQQQQQDQKPAPVKAERPAHIPEKFWDASAIDPLNAAVEKMSKAYGELERAKSLPQPKQGEQQQQQQPADQQQAPATDDAAKAAVEKAGVSYADMQAEFDQNGALSEATYEKLEKSGFPKPVVDSFIAGQHALAEQARQSAFQITGGKEEHYTAMTAWAKANLPADDIAAYNRGVTGSPADRSLAVQGLWSRYVAANGTPSAHMEQGNSSALSSGSTYASMQEMTRDIRDPRYSKDPAFRAAVEAKAARSNF